MGAIRTTLILALLLAGCASAGVRERADAGVDHDDLAGCRGERLLLVVAHPDDDLLFMSPDLLRAVRGGRCVRSVYLTAGDAGRDDDYWGAREAGIRAAYASMAGLPDRWSPSADGVYALEGAPRLSLVFLRLPDGRTKGQGFERRAFESLDKLWRGEIPDMATLDGRRRVSKEQLVTLLAELMGAFRPALLALLDPMRGHGDDHSDHAAAARFAFEALSRAPPRLVRFYRGYNIATLPPNLLPAEHQEKWQTFLIYAAHDRAMCQGGDPACLAKGPYFAYSQRQYPIEVVAVPRRERSLQTATPSSPSQSSDPEAPAPAQAPP